MASGKITSLILDKGFGFIAPEGASDSDLFFHNSAVSSGAFDSLQVGQAVTFETGADPRNPSRRRATNVRLVDPALEA